VSGSNIKPNRYLNVLAMDVYRNPTFLNTSGNQFIASPGSKLLDHTPLNDGGKIARSSGIDNNISSVTGKKNSTINISYSGMRENNTKGEYPSDSWGTLSTHCFDTSAKHVDDIEFINKLTQEGALWSWKEDPGHNGKPIIYRTIKQTGLTNSTSPYSLTQWNTETVNDPIDSSSHNGIMLFNYAIFSDYVVKPNHTIYWYASLFGATCYSNYDDRRDWVSRKIPDLNIDPGCGPGFGTASWAAWQLICSTEHNNQSGAGTWSLSGWGSDHGKFPMGVLDWDISYNQRRRWVIKVEVAGIGDQSSFTGDAVGSVGPHFYLPTNDCTLPPHFDVNLNAITENPITSLPFTDVAPGIRPDGMYSGHDQPGVSSWSWYNGSSTQIETTIPDYKRFDGNNIPTKIPGSVTWEIKELNINEGDGSQEYSSTNPAIWETEPKEDVGLDIYHEVGQIYPIYLNDRTIEQFVGPINDDTTKNSYVQCWDPPYNSVPGATGGGPGGATISLSTNPGEDIRVSGAYKNKVQLSDVSGAILGSAPGHVLPTIGSYLIFWRADGSTTEAHVKSITTDTANSGKWFELTGNENEGDIGVHNKMVTLPWFNCYSFGNGVESDRIRDDYNQVTIDNGPKASSTIEEPYLEDRRNNGFIWSGIFNSTSGVNNLNQFIQAEAITKDANPGYGSIQKLSSRDSDLVAFCEDRVLKILANKDALFNADGNTNVVATNRVLGAIRPFVGDYGISKNPESFASDSYRSYFADTSRGAILRLSQDGLTAISNVGMKDWFSDNLPNYIVNDLRVDGVGQIIGSFDDKKQEYNITLDVKTPFVLGTSNVSYSQPPASYTLSYSESSKGWVGFKSFIQESGVSLNNSYFTFKGGKMFEHHVNETRNNFYEDQYDSSVEILLNQAPGVIKSFSTLNYEGTQARITQDINNNPDYYDNIPKDGWYIKEMVSNTQELGELEFWDKEDKWFSQIKGVKTQWLNDGTAGNIDPKEFSYQGIGNAAGVNCPSCPTVVNTYNCIPGYYTTTYVPGSGTVNTWVPGYCNPVSGGLGQYASIAQCQQACIIPSTWNCITATSTTGGNPTTFCDEIFDGSGTYTSLGSCQAGCPPYSPPAPVASWNCSAAIGCIDPGDGSGQYATLSACQSACNTPHSWDCSPLGLGCFDPGTGNGQYSSLNDCLAHCPNASAVSYNCTNNQCIDPGDGTGTYSTLAACQSICTVTTVGPCNITNATIYDNNSSYALGDVVEYLGFYYQAGTNINPGQNHPGSITTDWAACMSNFVGPCDASAALTYDETNSYSIGDVVEITIWNGNLEYYYAIDNVPANYHHQPIGAVSVSHPGGYNASIYDPVTNTTNPWVSCALGISLIGSCLVEGWTNYDPAVTYGGSNTASQANVAGEIWVFYQGNFYMFDCEKWFNDIDYSTSTSITTGLPYTSSQMSTIANDMINACNIGITGQAPTGDHTGYWKQCTAAGNVTSATRGCCNDAYSLQWNLNNYPLVFDVACFNDPNCMCDYNLCT